MSTKLARSFLWAAAVPLGASLLPGIAGAQSTTLPKPTATAPVAPSTSAAPIAPSVSTAAPSAATKNEARERFDRGLKLFNEGENTGALAEFKRANELIPNSLVLFNIGLVYAAMNRPVEAAETLARVIAEPGTLSADRLARAKQVQSEQVARVADVAVTTNVPARIEVDNIEMGTTPLALPLRIPGGSHVVGAVATGYVPLHKEITVVGGARSEIALDLIPTDAKMAHLSLRTHLPSADVVIDGQLIAHTPLATSLTLAPGPHAIELRRSGYITAKQSITLGDGASGEVALEPDEDKTAVAREGGILVLDIGENQAVVTIDGKLRGPYVASLTLAPGPHQILVERGGFQPSERVVDIEPRRTTTIPILLDPNPDTRAAFVSKANTQRTWGWVGVAGGLAVAAGSVGFLVYNAGQKSDATAQRDVAATQSDAAIARRDQKVGVCDIANGGDFNVCNQQADQAASSLQSAQDHLDSVTGHDVIGYVGIGVGAVAAGVGLYALLSADNPHKYDRSSPAGGNGLILQPLFSTGSGGTTLGLRGTF